MCQELLLVIFVIKIGTKRTGDVDQLIECLPTVHETLGSINNTIYILSIVAYTCNPSTWKVETKRSRVQDHPGAA